MIRWFRIPALLLVISPVAVSQEPAPAGQTVTALEKRVAEAPRDVSARVSLARLYARRGDLEAEVAQWRALSRLVPREPEYHYQLGRAYLQLSAAYFKRISIVDPDSGRPYQALGESYFLQGKSQLAVRELERAVKADAGLPGVHLLLARIYLQQGRLDDARREVDRELAIVPTSAMALALRRKLAGARQDAPR